MSITVYKVASSEGKKVIITLQIPEDAITNMNRSSVAMKQTASYRTNKAFVLMIEDDDGYTYDFATSIAVESFTYEVGKMVEEPTYNEDPEEVCAEGIHFFLDRRVAEFYQYDEIENGLSKVWYHNGQKLCEVFYWHGKEDGLLQMWHENGKKKCEVLYVNGNRDGLYREWDEEGKEVCKKMYISGVEVKPQ